MILLDKFTGDLVIDNLVFKSALKTSEFLSLINKYEISIHTTTTGATFFTIPDFERGNTSLQFLFSNNILEKINIGLGKNYDFPPFTITDEEKELVKKNLTSIGGEQTYSWGSVRFNEDIKGGSVSICIDYSTH